MRTWIWTLGWLAITVMCLLFSAMSTQWYFSLDSDTPMYARLLGWLVSHEYAFGPGSGMVSSHPFWQAMPQLNKVVLGIHTILAAGALAIGPFQLHPAARRRFPRAHRIMGRLYVGLGMSAMLFAVAYLSMTPFSGTYGGAPFAIGLWGIAFVTLYTLTLGTFHARRGEIHAHMSNMVISFCSLLVAPFLRFWWALFGRLFPGTQADHHVAVLMFLGLISVVSAILAMRFGFNSPTSPRERALNSLMSGVQPFIERLAWPLTAAGGALGTLLIVDVSLRFGGSAGLWTSAMPAALRLDELSAFHGGSAWFALFALGTASSLLIAPRVLLDQFGGHLPAQVALLIGTSTIASLGQLGMAVTYGTHGVQGWGSGFLHGAVACSVLLMLAIATHALWTDDRRAVREFMLHSTALVAFPGAHAIGVVGFLAAGFTFEDAWLSAAVVGTSIMLSTSYYYTTYGARSPVPSPAVHTAAGYQVPSAISTAT